MNREPSPTDLSAFRSVLARELGLRFEDDKLAFLAELLASRVHHTGSADAAVYLDEVAMTAQETAELARALCVSETYFLRNRDQFHVLEALLRQRQVGSLRMLSAGCSSGEETYSLAIVAKESLQDLRRWSISILGVDLNPYVVEKARAARYPRWSLRDTSAHIRAKYFQQKGEQHCLTDEIREMVRFEQENLVCPSSALWKSQSFDIVFCRNVLMYFTPEAARKVVAAIARCLSPGGHLFLGHAENLRGLSQEFHLKHSHGTFYYERRSSAETSSEVEQIRAESASGGCSGNVPWFRAIALASNRIERLSHGSEAPRVTPIVAEGQGSKSPLAAPIHTGLEPALELMKQERFQEALLLLIGTSAAASDEPDALLLHAMLLASTGQLAGAEGVCRKLLGVDDLNAGAHYVTAICREQVGDRLGAVEHSRAASYLDSQFAMPHLQLGRLARRSGELATAQRELKLALELLVTEDSARIVLFGGGFSRDVLIQLCQGELAACGGNP